MTEQSPLSELVGHKIWVFSSADVIQGGGVWFIEGNCADAHDYSLRLDGACYYDTDETRRRVGSTWCDMLSPKFSECSYAGFRAPYGDDIWRGDVSRKMLEDGFVGFRVRVEHTEVARRACPIKKAYDAGTLGAVLGHLLKLERITVHDDDGAQVSNTDIDVVWYNALSPNFAGFHLDVAPLPVPAQI